VAVVGLRGLLGEVYQPHLCGADQWGGWVT
jgi:hypothetical protein